MNCETNCEKCQELLGAHIEGLLDEQSSQPIVQHLQTCSQCSEEFKELDKLHNRLAEYRKTVAQRPAEDRVMDQILRRQANQSRRQEMTRRYGKVGLAASVAAAIIVALTFANLSPNGSGTVWAIEQTIAALQQINAVHFKGTFVDAEQGEATMPLEALYRADLHTDEVTATPLMFRMGEAAGGAFSVRLGGVVGMSLGSADGTRFSTCNIPVDMFAVCTGPKYWHVLKEAADNWQEEYGPDEATGVPCVFVTFTATTGDTQYWFWVQFDLETDLPMRFKQWDNANREGAPLLAVDEIAYNTEPEEGLFPLPSKNIRSALEEARAESDGKPIHVRTATGKTNGKRQ